MLLLCTKAVVEHTSSGLPATAETATSFGKVWQVLDKLHTLLCTLWLRSAHYEFMEHAAAAVQVNGLGD